MKSIREIEHIRQQKKNDCAVACLSMITGIEMDFIEADMNHDGFERPFSMQAVLRFLTRNGIYAEKQNFSMNIALIPNSLYLCTTSSKCGRPHMVVMSVFENSSRILDPNDDLGQEKTYSFDYGQKGSFSIFEFFHLTDCSIHEMT